MDERFANIILYEQVNLLILVNKPKTQVKIIWYRAFFGTEVTVISLDNNIGDRFVLQAHLKDLPIQILVIFINRWELWQ